MEKIEIGGYFAVERNQYWPIFKTGCDMPEYIGAKDKSEAICLLNKFNEAEKSLEYDGRNAYYLVFKEQIDASMARSEAEDRFRRCFGDEEARDALDNFGKMIKETRKGAPLDSKDAEAILAFEEEYCR